MPGWIRLAGIALELTALAYVGYVVMGRARKEPALHASREEPAPQERPPQPMEFITESADEGARIYRAQDERGEVLAGFYADGRVRLADAQHRFAGMLQAGQADLLEIDDKQWSQLFVRTTPTGRMQLELRGGPYDARVLTCKPLDA